VSRLMTRGVGERRDLFVFLACRSKEGGLASWLVGGWNWGVGIDPSRRKVGLLRFLFVVLVPKRKWYSIYAMPKTKGSVSSHHEYGFCVNFVQSHNFLEVLFRYRV